jgi:4-amino-4-deoxy-L-arabinose transferase-like glycosyltransferase
MMIQTCIAIFLPTLLGFFIIAVILRNDKETPLGERIGLSFPLGAGILTLQMFLLGILRVPLTLFNTTLPVLAELFGLAIWIWGTGILLIPRPSSGLLAEMACPKNHWVKKCIFSILAIWIGAKLGSVFLEACLRPIYSTDSWRVWSAGAKVFFDARSLLLDAPAQDFFGKSAVSRIIFYPLHANLIQVWMSLWIGTFDEVLVKFYNAIYLLSMAIGFYYISIRETNRILALALLAIILSSPLLSYHSIESNSDLMLGVYLFFASASFLKAMRKKAAYWILTGIYSAEALFIKQEAFFFILPLIISAIGYLKFDTEKSHRKPAHILLLLVPFLAVIPWYIFTVYYGLGWEKMAGWIGNLNSSYLVNDPHRITEHMTFHPEIITGYLCWLASLNNFNVIIIFFPLLLITKKRIYKESLYLMFPIICYMIFFILIYMFSSYYVWFLNGTVFYRNILTCYPAICLLTLLLLKKDDSFNRDTEEDHDPT